MAIIKSVGEGGYNDPADVRFVQLLLADWLARQGESVISVDGIVGQKLLEQLGTFRRT